MALEFSCPACQTILQLANPSWVGKRVKCPQCGDAILVPTHLAGDVPEFVPIEPSAPESDSNAAAPRKTPARTSLEDRSPTHRRRFEADDEVQPRRRRSAPAGSGTSAAVWILVSVGGVLLVCGGLVTVIIVLVNRAATNTAASINQVANVIKEAEKAQQVKKAVEGPHVEVMLGVENFRKMAPQLFIGNRVTIKGEISLLSTQGKKVLVHLAAPYVGPQLPIQATDLTRDFITDRLGAERKYKGNNFPFYEVVVAGVVREVQPNRFVVLLEGADGGNLVMPVEKDNGKIYQIPLKGLSIPDRLADGDLRGPLGPRRYCKIYRVRMLAGKSYVIRMNARDQNQLDTLLCLEDANRNRLAVNDDAPGENTLNSRIDFVCNQTGVYRIIATSLGNDVVGDYTLIISRTK